MRLFTEALPHQLAACDKLSRLRVGALFMDMGTGKSRTVLEWVSRRRQRIDRVVWFCPCNLRETVRAEIAKHSEGEPVYVFGDATTQRTLPSAFWYVVGIESMSSSRRCILAANRLVDGRTLVVVDESSYIKGHRAARTQWITRIGQRARYRLLLTGTPLSNGVQDLYAQMRFLSPEILGYRSWYSFAANHLEYSERFKGLVVRAHNTRWLAAKIAPYVYQVTKGECLELPSKLYSTRWCSLTAQQRDLYDQAKEDLLNAWSEETELDQYAIFRLFTALQEIVCGFWWRYPPLGRAEREPELLTVPHRRLDLLLEALGELPGEKVIVWAKYPRCLEEIAQGIQATFEEGSELFHGGLTHRQREEALARWRAGSRFLLATPACGGHGLNLTECAYQVFYTNDFKLSERLQAEDRCHRIGQGRPVTYLDLLCGNTIDERIADALQRKVNVLREFRQRVKGIRDKHTMKQALEAL